MKRKRGAVESDNSSSDDENDALSKAEQRYFKNLATNTQEKGKEAYSKGLEKGKVENVTRSIAGKAGKASKAGKAGKDGKGIGTGKGGKGGKSEDTPIEVNINAYYST